MVRQIGPIKHGDDPEADTGPSETVEDLESQIEYYRHIVAHPSPRLLPGELGEDCQRYIQAWINDSKPRNRSEELVLQYAAESSWRLHLANHLESLILRRQVLEAVATCEGENAEALTEAATLASFDFSKEGERLRRRQSSLHRDMLRGLDTFRKMRKLRIPRAKEG